MEHPGVLKTDTVQRLQEVHFVCQKVPYAFNLLTPKTALKILYVHVRLINDWKPKLNPARSRNSLRLPVPKMSTAVNLVWTAVAKCRSPWVWAFPGAYMRAWEGPLRGENI